jgi:hypothetical protein
VLSGRTALICRFLMHFLFVCRATLRSTSSPRFST